MISHHTIEENLVTFYYDGVVTDEDKALVFETIQVMAMDWTLREKYEGIQIRWADTRHDGCKWLVNGNCNRRPDCLTEGHPPCPML